MAYLLFVSQKFPLTTIQMNFRENDCLWDSYSILNLITFTYSTLSWRASSVLWSRRLRIRTFKGRGYEESNTSELVKKPRGCMATGQHIWHSVVLYCSYSHEKWHLQTCPQQQSWHSTHIVLAERGHCTSCWSAFGRVSPKLPDPSWSSSGREPWSSKACERTHTCSSDSRYIWL